MNERGAILAQRWRSHLLDVPAPTLRAAAAHMTATQAQEIWGGKYAIAARTAGFPSARAVDAAFDAGEIVRTWPMRGTLHIMAADDLGWMLPITADRVFRSTGARHRELGLAADDFLHAERVWRRVLSGGGLRRADALAALNTDGLDTAGQRGAHLILALANRGVVHWGKTVPRLDGAAATEQLLTLNDDLPTQRPTPSDPLAELGRRYLQGHAPASIRDFAWWSGLPITQARRAFPGNFRDDTLLVPGGEGPAEWAPGDDVAPTVIRALGTFEEYYISYADRSVTADDDIRTAVGPGKNGMVRALIIRDGQVSGRWTRSGDLDVLDPALSEADARAAMAAWAQHRDG